MDIKMDPEGIGCVDVKWIQLVQHRVEWIQLVQHRVEWRAIINTIRNLRVS
jgi:hypothetical protein